MKIEELIQRLEEEFEDLSVGLTPDTDFRQLDEWSSMHALIIIALVDTEYEVSLNGNDLKSMKTVQDLYNLVQERKRSEWRVDDAISALSGFIGLMLMELESKEL